MELCSVTALRPARTTVQLTYRHVLLADRLSDVLSRALVGAATLYP